VKQQMLALEILYVAFATIGVLILLQLFTYIGVRLMYPPEPKIIYREVPVPYQPPPAPVQQAPPPPAEPPRLPPTIKISELYPKNELALSQDTQDIKLPEYEPRKPASNSLRMDAELPAGLQETRPDGL